MKTLPNALTTALRSAASGGSQLSEHVNAKGTITAWFEVAETTDLHKVGQVLKDAGARLSTITSMKPNTPEDEDAEGETPIQISLNGSPIDGTSYQILYHFDLDGDTLSVSIYLPEGKGEVPSLTPLFRNADWPERELMEIYHLHIIDHPDPRRLFLDESIDTAVLDRLIPLSTLANAASTQSLWEKIITHHEPGDS